jgi:hypothetical protein
MKTGSRLKREGRNIHREHGNDPRAAFMKQDMNHNMPNMPGHEAGDKKQMSGGKHHGAMAADFSRRNSHRRRHLSGRGHG